MKVTKMTKEDFDNVPSRKWGKDIGDFNSLVIIPTGELHDSGFMCMDFVAVDDKNEPIAKLSGCSDVIHLDGIGGYGKRNWHCTIMGTELPRMVSPKGWCIDILPCGYVRIFSRNRNGLSCSKMSLSDFELWSDAK